MIPAILILVVFSALLTGAHFLRDGAYGWFMFSLSAPLLLLIRRPWALKSLQLLLAASVLVWMHTLYELISMRLALHQPWLRMTLILILVALVPLAGIWTLQNRRFQASYQLHREKWLPATMVFILTTALLWIIQLKVSRPMLILERLIPGSGEFEILLLSAYAAWMTEKMLDPGQSGRWRRRLWAFFSLVFFAQLILGLAGLEKFLMTGKLHLPIPALIVAGPIYRAGGYFMLALFAAAVLLVGPAWCSHLCYMGVWDNLAADHQRRPAVMPAWRPSAQITIAALVLLTALGLRFAGAAPLLATSLALGFGFFGIGLVLFWSRKRGVMTHCITFCPIGLFATWLGKLSFFRIKIAPSCTDCGACRLACRYDALNWPEIQARQPNRSCTLCGDCVGSCPHRSLRYRFAGWDAENARTVFLVVIITLHALFLGMARI